MAIIVVANSASLSGGVTATYTPDDAVTLLGPYIKGIPVTAIKVVACDLVNSTIYTAFPWRWTLATFTAITLVDDQQDYSITQTDVYRITGARLRRTDITPDDFRELTPVEYLPPDAQKRGYQQFGYIAYEVISKKLRLPFPPAISGSMVVKIEGEYQRNPVKIVSGTMATAFWFPDQYFPVFVEGLKWAFYQFTDDPRAGSIQVVNGRSIYTGQLGVFQARLWQMKQAEDYGNANSFVFPSEPLGASVGNGGVGIFA